MARSLHPLALRYQLLLSLCIVQLCIVPVLCVPAVSMDSNSQQGERNDTSEVEIRSQLQQCCSALMRIADNLSGPATQAHQQEGSQTQRDQTVFTEHRSLFRNPVGYPTSRTRVRRSPYHLPPRPSPRLWTHKFYCLASVGATSVPSSKPVKDALATAGLGEKNLSIPMAGTPADLHQHLLRLYPPLAECGGYTLLRCIGNSKTLQIVEPPPSGHSAVSLASAVGQSRVYIRPLQRDIPLLQQHQSHQAPKETCLKCSEVVDLASLPAHLRSCQGSSSSPASVSGKDHEDDDLDDFEPVRIRFRIPERLSTNHPSRTVSPPSSASSSNSNVATPLNPQPGTSTKSADLQPGTSTRPAGTSLLNLPPLCEVQPGPSGLQADDEIAQLREMFPDVPKAVFHHMIVDDKLSIETVIDVFVDQNSVKSTDLGRILNQHSEKIMNNMESDVHLTLSRSCIWNKAKMFYKAALNNPKVLRKNLVIQFSGEEGLDLGALKKEFFAETLHSISREVFEGQSTRLLPKCQWGDDTEYRIAGVAIAHSILQGGPGFCCLHPALYRYIITQTSEDYSCDVEALPCVTDIPRNASTEDLLDFIEKLNSATTQMEIDDLLDVPSYLAVVNASGWPPTLRLTVPNRAEFINGVVLQEVVQKREGAMKSVCAGMEELGLVTLIRCHANIMKEVFVHSPHQFDSKCLKALIMIDQANLKDEECATLEWFWKYIESRDDPDQPESQPSVKQILKFCTGLEEYPPMGLEHPITLEFLSGQNLPQASVCFGVIKLPDVESEEEFFRRMDEGILGSLNHYGTL